MTLSYIEHLELNLATNPPKQKGQRTRDRLTIATAKALEQRGYHAMRVTDITDIAQVAEGLFYTYFNDKLEVTLRILTSMLEDFFPQQEGREVPIQKSFGDASYDAIYRANLRWILQCRANSGLMRCILQVGDQEPQFALLSQHINNAWHKRVAQHILRHRPGKGPALLFTVILGAMMDEMVRKLIVYPDPTLLELLDELDGDDELIAHATSVVWLRVLYPDAGLPPDLPEQAEILARWTLPAKA